MLENKRDRLRAEYKAQALEEEILDMQEELNGTPEEEGLNSDSLLMSLLSKVVGGTPTIPPSMLSGVPKEKISITDEQLREYKARIPAKILKKLRKMSDAELIVLGKQYNPDLFLSADEETVQRAISILKE